MSICAAEGEIKVTSLQYLQMQGKLCSKQNEVRMPKLRISQSDLSDHVISKDSPHIGSISMTKIIIRVLSLWLLQKNC